MAAAAASSEKAGEGVSNVPSDLADMIEQLERALSLERGALHMGYEEYEDESELQLYDGANGLEQIVEEKAED